MGTSDPVRVEVLRPHDVGEIVSVLCESFFEYPVMRFVLGLEGDYSSRLGQLVTFFVMARVLRDETLLGVRASGGLIGAALVSKPGSSPPAPELVALRDRTWTELGSEARSRYEAFGKATAGFEVQAPHMHLNMIGVRPSVQSRGLGRAMLEAVHDLSATDPDSSGVTLTTEAESNVMLYEHFGYKQVGRANVGSAFTTWGFYRPDR